MEICNEFVVISYWLPGDEEHSGLSLIGTHKVDESICAIFDHLRNRGERPRVVNIPEFVVNELYYPDLFQFKTDGSDDEYVIALEKFAQFDDLPQYMRISIRKFIRKFGRDALQMRNINLHLERNRQLLLDVPERWPLKGVNSMTKRGREVFPLTIAKGAPLGIKCAGLFIHGELEACSLYFPSSDGRYFTIAHARVNYDIPRIFGYFVHALSKHMLA